MIIITTSQSHIAALEKQTRRLKALLGVVTAGIGVVVLSGSTQTQPTRFTQIDVERINIVSPDGKPVLVLANAQRIPDPVVDGTPIARTGPKRPGILFYNEAGDENGGLIFDGKLGKDGKPRAGMHFSMDRFGGDQQLALGHYESGGTMESGLNIYDRGLHKDYALLREAYGKAVPGPAGDAVRQQWKDAGGEQVKRLFIGKTRGKSSALVLADANGKPRIQMLVTPEGKASLEFLDEKGGVVQRLPQPAVN